MAWTQNNNRNNNYNQNNRGGGNFQSNQNNQQPQYKKSGATYTKIKDGMKKGFHHISAWRSTKQGLMKASCFPQLEYVNDKPTEVKIFKGEGGGEFVKYVCTVTMGASVSKHYCLMSLDSKKIYLKDLNLVITPNGQGKTRNGKTVKGYFGQTQ